MRAQHVESGLTGEMSATTYTSPVLSLPKEVFYF